MRFPFRLKSESYCLLYLVVPAVLKALSYDEMRGSYSVGEQTYFLHML